MEWGPREAISTKFANDAGIEVRVGCEPHNDEAVAPSLFANLGQQLVNSTRSEGVEVFDLAVTAEVGNEVVGDLTDMPHPACAAILVLGAPAHFKNPQRQIGRWPK